MKIGILSDIHELSWIFKLQNQNKRDTALEYLIKDILFKGAEQMDLLIIAGDIGESPSRVVMFLRAVILYTNIPKILFVPGNHEHYSNYKFNRLYNYPTRYTDFEEELLSDKTSLLRYRALEEMVFPYEKDPLTKVSKLVDYINENVDNVIATNDGKTLDINGIKIAGTAAWYDGLAYYEQTKNIYGTMPFESNFIQKKINKIYKENLDSRYVSNEPFELWNTHYKEIVENMENNLDILITHTIPMIESIAIDEIYKNDPQNGFFTFDGIKMIEEKRPKYWVHGHSHQKLEIEVYDTIVLRAPVGHMTEWDARGQITNLTYIEV